MKQEIEITKGDIDGIAKKLDEFAAVLSDREYIVLMSMFGVAAKVIKDAASKSGNQPTQPTKPTHPPLLQGFRNAFMPGGVTKFTIDDSETEGVEVTVGVKYTF